MHNRSLFLTVAGLLLGCLVATAPASGQTQPTGNINDNQFLKLGPFSNTFIGCNGFTDQIAIENQLLPTLLEDLIGVLAGDEILYDPAQSSMGGTNVGPVGPLGGPQWELFDDGNINGDLNFDQIGLGDLSDHAIYVATYIEVVGPENFVGNLCVGADDGFTVVIDGFVVSDVADTAFCRAVADCQETFAIDLEPGVHFIVLGVYERAGGWQGRLALQDSLGLPVLGGDPRIVFLGPTPNRKAVRSLSTPTDATTCPPTLGGPASGEVQRDLDATQDGSEPVTVVETLTGPFEATAIDAPGATSIEPLVITTGGFIRDWNLLGPFALDGAINNNNPGLPNMQLDFIDDGAGNTEAAVEPVAGDPQNIDFGGAAASPGIVPHPNEATLAPGGVPTWTAWTDADDTINFNEVYGGDVNQNIMYGICYFEAPANETIDVGVDSDDSIQVLVGPVGGDATEVIAVSQDRGVQAAETVVDRNPDPVPVQAGLNKIVVKVFEGAGGHGFRLRLEKGGIGLTDLDDYFVYLDPDGTVPGSFNANGFIQTWLFLPPVATAVPGPGDNPGIVYMRADLLTDGAGVTEDNFDFMHDSKVKTDFGGASLAAGIRTGDDANPTTDPNATPTVMAWSDADDTIDYNGIGGNLANNMYYAVSYVRSASARTVDIGLGSDDSILVKVNNEEVFVHEGGRGYGAEGEIQDTAVGVQLNAGVNKVMTKVFEGGGGHGFRLRFQDPATGDPITDIDICSDPDGVDCQGTLSPRRPNGAIVTWETTTGDLDAGISYTVNFDDGTLAAAGTTNGVDPIIGDSFVTVLPPDFVDVAVGPFDHGHRIGDQCPGTSITGDDDVITIAGAGEDIWVNGDQFMYAYSEVTGDFSARITIANQDFAPGSRWGKHGIMARQDCSLRSRYSWVHDQGLDPIDTTRFAARPTHQGSDNYETPPPGLAGESSTHFKTLRLDRVGDEFVGYVFDNLGLLGEPCSWVEVAREDWGPDAPPSVQLGLAVTSHQGCDVTTIDFTDWEFVQGAVVSDPPCARPVLNLMCLINDSGGIDVSWENDPGASLEEDTLVLNNGALVASVPGTQTSYTFDAADLSGDVSTITVIAGNGVSAPQTCTLFTGTELYINAGGARLDDAFGTGLGDGRTWEEDSIGNPSPFLTSPNANTADFAFPADPVSGEETVDLRLVEPDFTDLQGQLFSTERWNDGPVEYTIPVTRCDYEVILLFAEGCCSDGCEDLFDPTFSFIDPDGDGVPAPCRVVDVFVNDELVLDQFSQHVEIHRELDETPLPNAEYGIALAMGPFEAIDTEVVTIRIEDLGGGDIPQNASIKGIAVRSLDPQGCGGVVVGEVFKRGDVDGNGILEITDVVNDLAFQFLGQYTPICLDAHDFDDNGLNEITDAVNSLGHQFLGDPPPPAPGTATCGVDPTDDGLDCAAYTEQTGCAR